MLGLLYSVELHAMEYIRNERNLYGHESIMPKSHRRATVTGITLYVKFACTTLDRNRAEAIVHDLVSRVHTCAMH